MILCAASAGARVCEQWLCQIADSYRYLITKEASENSARAWCIAAVNAPGRCIRLLQCGVIALTLMTRGSTAQISKTAVHRSTAWVLP